MKLHILSDLHIEFGPFDLPHTDADVFVLAGDIHVKNTGLKWIQQNCKDAKPVLYVLGNHEFYGTSIPHLTNRLKEASVRTSILVLENGHVVINGVHFLGCTLWTDFKIMGDAVSSAIEAREEMNDYRRIRLSTRGFRRLRPVDTIRFHEESRRWLNSELASLPTGSKKVIITHHAPSIHSVHRRYRNDPLTPAFAANLDGLVIASGAELWIHGHGHTSHDYMLGATRVICNPRGYATEPNPDFDPQLVVEI